jgi:hypothetical protein
VLRGYAAGAKPKINYLRAAQGCLFSRVLAPLAMQFAAAQKQTNTFIPSTTIVTQPRYNKHCVAFGDGVDVDVDIKKQMCNFAMASLSFYLHQSEI